MREFNSVFTVSDATVVSAVSKPVFIAHIFGFSVQAKAIGTADGTVKVQVSNDDKEPDSITEWTDLDTASITLTTSPLILNKDAIYFRWMRLVYTKGTAPVGSVVATVNGKGA